MDDGKISFERRSHNRYKVKDGAFAVHRENISKRKFGKILDISNGGLSFSYFGTKKSSSGTFDLDILSLDTDFKLEKLQSKIISDYAIKEQTRPGFIIKRRRGVQFEKLLKNQISKLKYFITHYTIVDE